MTLKNKILFGVGIIISIVLIFIFLKPGVLEGLTKFFNRGEENDTAIGLREADKQNNIEVDISKLPPAPDLHVEISYSKDLDPSFVKMLAGEIEKIHLLIDESPYEAKNWIDLGSIYKISGNLGKTRIVWEYASLLSPSNYALLVNLGSLYGYDLKDSKLAEETFNKTLVLNPPEAYVYVQIARFYVSVAHNTAKAREALKIGLRNLPGNEDLAKQLASI